MEISLHGKYGSCQMQCRSRKIRFVKYAPLETTPQIRFLLQIHLVEGGFCQLYAFVQCNVDKLLL